MTRRQTPSQTAGPFFSMGLLFEGSNVLAGPEVDGTPVHVTGRVLDGDEQPVGDALIEVWQADSRGRYGELAEGGFSGFGRAATDLDTGFYSLLTVKPGRVAGPTGRLQAPHLNLLVLARGLLQHLYTRLYFGDEASNAEDPVLTTVPEARRATLVATPLQPDSGVLLRYAFDVRLQGPGETVFFDV